MKVHGRYFCFMAFFVGWWSWSFGISLDVSSPNIEIHLPFIFIKVGWEKHCTYNYSEVSFEAIGKREIGYRGLTKRLGDNNAGQTI